MKNLHNIELFMVMSLVLFAGNAVGMDTDMADYTIFDAIEENNNNYVQRAIARGEHINRQNNENETPLFFAILHNQEDIAIELIATRENVNRPCLDGLSPLVLAIAMYNTNIVKALIKAGANVNARDFDGKTGLMEAVLNNHLDMVNLIINADEFDTDQLEPIIEELERKMNKTVEEQLILEALQKRWSGIGLK